MYDIELSVHVPGVRKPKVSERTALLFTHRGYSGPAVLDLSHYAVKALTRASTSPTSPQPRIDAALTAAASTSGSGSITATAGNIHSCSGGRYEGMGLPSIRVNWTHEPASVWDERIRVSVRVYGEYSWSWRFPHSTSGIKYCGSASFVRGGESPLSKSCFKAPCISYSCRTCKDSVQ